ncbi:PDZ domain-containing protein [Novosphingobium sp.]|uniref:PDZ domain-containing protein n=1 Tax=Novosphingobium sp. TaxID=1874826 RepID=UPI001DA02242|nr:PDZ domain-containing protein [Novosphingobium sp.]MBX9663877.1 PDZ domain-containing protein [Novosphingobium sp.]
MNGSFHPRHTPFIAWAFPLVVLSVCAVAVLMVHLAGAPEHTGLAGLTFEAASEGPGDAVGGDRGKASSRLIVTSVKSGGPAEAAGIRAGDVIEQIDGVEIHSVGDVDRALTPNPARPVHLQLGRPGILLEAELPNGSDLAK